MNFLKTKKIILKISYFWIYLSEIVLDFKIIIKNKSFYYENKVWIFFYKIKQNNSILNGLEIKR